MQSFIGPSGHWETYGGIGLLWAALAILAIGIGGRTLKVPTLVTFGMLIYVFGGSMFIDRLPGFSSFRMPTRMLLTMAFPIAFLAGSGIDLLKTTATRRNVWWATLVAMILAIPVVWHRLDSSHAEPFLAKAFTLYQILYWSFVACSSFVLLRIPERFLSKRVGLVAFLMIGELLIISPPLTRSSSSLGFRRPRRMPVLRRSSAGPMCINSG